MKEREARALCRVPCTLRVGEQGHAVSLTDFTDRGFQVDCELVLGIGVEVALAIPGCLPVVATVRWSLGRKAGFAFDRPVRFEAIAAAVEAATTSASLSAAKF